MILIALGANLPSRAGAPELTLRAALAAIDRRGIRTGPVSHFYRTPAWPEPVDPWFVNAAARLTTRLGPLQLLELLHDVETEFGRNRSGETKKNAPRTLDLDLLDYEGLIQPGPPELPHPRIAERGFVLIPLRDIASDWRHPVTGKSVDEMIATLGPAIAEVELVSTARGHELGRLDVDRLSFRPVRESDADLVLAITELSMRPYVEQTLGEWVEADIRRRFSTLTDTILRYDGYDIGCVALKEEADALRLLKIFIVPSYQNRGIGSHLVRQLCERSLVSGKPLRLRVLRSNPARRLYERLGFALTEATQTHYHLEWDPRRG
jgi:2-amino-4-hydroxy-6-hydroxymethyldihydropteridine diphosphokinase